MLRSILADVTLVLHIASGALALALGPAAIITARRRGRDNRTGAAYHAAVLAVCATAGVLAALDWSRLWWFVPIAGGSYALALLGRVASKRSGGRWARLYVHGQGGSYIALVTALLVVSTGSPAAWIVPTLIGAPLLQRAARELDRPPAHGPHCPAAAGSVFDA